MAGKHGWKYDLIFGSRGDDVLAGGDGRDVIFGGAGDDRGIYRLSDNLDAMDLYDGGSGKDTLHLVLNLEQALDPAVQADLAAYGNFLSTPIDDDDDDDDDDDAPAPPPKSRGW